MTDKNEAIEETQENTALTNAITIGFKAIEARLIAANKLHERGYSNTEICALMNTTPELLLFEDYLYQNFIAGIKAQNEAETE